MESQIKNMNDQIYLILILIFIIIVLSRFIIRFYNTNHPKTKAVIFYFRRWLGFLIAMTIYIIVEAIQLEGIMF
jgi:hypothetical protein